VSFYASSTLIVILCKQYFEIL